MQLFGSCNRWVASHSNSLSAWASLITIISIPLLLIGLFIGYYQVHDILTLPDAALEFVHPSSIIAYMVINRSEKIAEDIPASFGLFDLDNLSNGPVPIPSVRYDYVNAESRKGPFHLFAQFATEGHRYFVIAFISCRGGKILRTYWIYSKHGFPEDGFWAERNENDTYQINPRQLAIDADYLALLVPVSRRKPIPNG